MSLYRDFARIDEAYRVHHGLPGPRRFSDAELAPSVEGIAATERDLYGGLSADEHLGRLSHDEQRLLDELNARPLIPFRVTAHLGGYHAEEISILARTSCDAVVQAVQLLFLDAGDCITATGFKVKVEPICAQAADSKEAA